MTYLYEFIVSTMRATCTVHLNISTRTLTTMTALSCKSKSKGTKKTFILNIHKRN